MKIKGIHYTIFLCVGVFLLGLILWTLYRSTTASNPLHLAQEKFVSAEKASNIIQQSQDLNQALNIYTELVEQYHPIHGNGTLYNNIAEIFYDLEQYPWAAFYFYQAKTLMPRNQEIEKKLQTTLTHLNIASKTEDSIFKKVFFFHFNLSLPERLQILSVCTLLLLGLASLYLWRKYQFLKGCIALIMLVWVLFFCSVIATKYFEPLEGVMIRSSMLYREADSQSPVVNSKPIISGNKVEVLDVLEEGKWLKIHTKDGMLGFVLADSLRLIKV